MAPSRAAKKPRITCLKRPAAAPDRNAAVAPEPLAAGQLVFEEDALVAAQALRRAEDFVAQQPLFCANCCGPCGSLLVDLSLANHTIHRAELLNVVRTSARDGDVQRLQRWLDFATKRAGLPQVPGAPEAPGLHVMDVPDTSPQADLCFCSLDCRNTFPPEMCMEKSPLLSAANKLIARAALLPGGNGLRSKDEFMTLLQPLLQCVRGRSRLSFSQSMLEGCHRRLIGVLAERIPGTKAMARKAARALVAPELYSRIVASLDTRSWSLNGETLPSRLGQYCEGAFAPGAMAPALQSEAAQVLGPVVDDLLQLQEELSESSAEEVELVVPLPQTNEAKKSSVVFWPKLLSNEEIDQILQFSAKMRGESEAQWSTCYLQSGGAHGSLQPILKKLKDLALHVDARPGGWKRLHGDLHTRLRSRCVEHHSVTTGGALPDPTHFDGGSLFTIDVMLNTPGVDFQGGEFCTMESDDTLHPHHFGKGDALVFLSHKAHCVQPVTSGLRQTLVMELWEGEERCCNHRCQQRWGPCTGSSSTAHSLQRLREEGPNLFAATAFDGVAFFPSLGRILRQSAKRRKAEANVEVLFEEVKPKAFVRTTRKIRKGEMLVLK